MPRISEQAILDPRHVPDCSSAHGQLFLPYQKPRVPRTAGGKSHLTRVRDLSMPNLILIFDLRHVVKEAIDFRAELYARKRLI